MAEKFGWIPAKTDELIDLYYQGATRREMAEHFGVSVSAIQNKLNKLSKVGAIHLKNHRGEEDPKPEQPAKPKQEKKCEDKSDTLMLAARLIKTMEAARMDLMSMEFISKTQGVTININPWKPLEEINGQQ